MTLLGDVSQIVPNLTTSLTGPLLALEQYFLDHQIAIETWLRKAWLVTPAPIQSSVDLRNAGFKLAPVDTNLFPAGFNNLSQDSIPLCIQALQATFSQLFPGCEKILLIPESHTRNIFYLENIATLSEMLQKAGYQVKIGTLIEELTPPIDISLPSGKSLKLHNILRNNQSVYLTNYMPCMILLNNDLSDGVPHILNGLQQPIQPPIKLGWAYRSKANHFNYYQQITKQFANDIGIDPWLINPLFTTVDNIDFHNKADLQKMAAHAEQLLNDIAHQYLQHGINSQPFIVIKADNGTYGMGVLPVTDVAQIMNLNRKERSKMAVKKGNRPVTKVIIQEGIPTFETIGPNNDVAEPVVYMIGQNVVGGFYRVHKDKRENENLNSPGMHFHPLAFNQSCINPDSQQNPDAGVNRFYAYGVVARLALLAAAHEAQDA